MVIKNQTKMKKEHIRAVMRASNFDNDRYKKFKLMYNLFGLLFGMMFVRYLMFEMLGNGQQEDIWVVLYGGISAVFLYIGMYGMDRSNYKKFYSIYGNMVGVTFTYEADSEGVRMTDEEGDSELFEWNRMLKCTEDIDSFFVYMGLEECLIIDKTGFVEGTDKEFRELLKAIMGLRKEREENEQMSEKLKVKELTSEEISEIYNTYLVEDFPASEVKPLSQMISAKENGQYEAYGLFEDDVLKGYAYFIKTKKQPVILLDYFAVLSGLRSSGYGSAFLSKLQQMCMENKKQLILEVENPIYEVQEDKKSIMNRRIAFYEKNNMVLSNVSCNFYNNEYRIMYAGKLCEDKVMQEKIKQIYEDFFGVKMVNENVVFHDFIADAQVN